MDKHITGYKQAYHCYERLVNKAGMIRSDPRLSGAQTNPVLNIRSSSCSKTGQVRFLISKYLIKGSLDLRSFGDYIGALYRTTIYMASYAG